MAFTAFPTGNDVGGGKTIKEIYWAPLTTLLANKSFVFSGYTVAANESGLILHVAAGKSIIKAVLGAYYVENTATSTITLTNGETNYVFLTLTVDGNSKISTAELTKNSTGILPDNSIPICSAIASGGNIISTVDLRPKWTWAGTGGHAHTGVDGEGAKVAFSDILGTIDESQLPTSLDGVSADMLDGMHADEFAVYNHNHDAAYVNVTGDTMTGDLVIEKATPEITLTGNSGNAGINLGNPSTPNAQPKIDFHYGVGYAQDYNVRIVNSADKTLNIFTSGNDAVLKLNGVNVLVDGQTVVGSDTLDGYHAADFLLKAGGTMTGNLGMEMDVEIRKIIFKYGGADKWGIAGDTGGISIEDWVNNRTPFHYNSSGAVTLGTSANGIAFYSVSASAFVLQVGGNTYKVWNEGNDGSGSGLDADTVDGIHISVIETDYVHCSGGWSFGHWLHNIIGGALHWAFGNGSDEWWGFEGHSHGMRCWDWHNDRSVWEYDEDTMTLTFNIAHHHKCGNHWFHHSGRTKMHWCDVSGNDLRGFEHYDHGIKCHDWNKNRSVWVYDADDLTFVFNDEHTHHIGTHPIWHEGNLAALYVYLDQRYVLQTP